MPQCASRMSSPSLGRAEKLAPRWRRSVALSAAGDAATAIPLESSLSAVDNASSLAETACAKLMHFKSARPFLRLRRSSVCARFAGAAGAADGADPAASPAIDETPSKPAAASSTLLLPTGLPKKYWPTSRSSRDREPSRSAAVIACSKCMPLAEMCSNGTELSALAPEPSCRRDDALDDALLAMLALPPSARTSCVSRSLTMSSSWIISRQLLPCAVGTIIPSRCKRSSSVANETASSA